MATETQTPEERELERKRAELAKLETELVDRELDLTPLRQELATFDSEYLRIVGRRYAALDDIKARIAEARAARSGTQIKTIKSLKRFGRLRKKLASRARRLLRARLKPRVWRRL